jgi:hypothetical protein
VAVVEDRAPPGALELIGFDVSRFDSCRRRDHIGQRGRIARQQRRRVDLEVVDQCVLRDLTEATAVLTLGQRGQYVRVRDDRARLVERADEILAFGQIHAGLATDGRVDHREQRRRYLNDIDAPVVRGGREAGRVPDNSTTTREHDVAPQQTPLCELATQSFDGRERLVLFAVAHQEGRVVDTRRRDRVGRDRRARNAGLRDDRNAPATRDETAETLVRILDHDVVAAFAELDAHLGHDTTCANSPSTRSATAATDSSPSTTTWAAAS